jgi:type II secretory pathway component PulK
MASSTDCFFLRTWTGLASLDHGRMKSEIIRNLVAKRPLYRVMWLMNKARNITRTICAIGLGLLIFAAARPGFSQAVRPDAGMVAAVDAAGDTLVEGTTRGTLDGFYWNIHAGYDWERTATKIASNGLFRVDYSVFQEERNRNGARPNLSILLFRPSAAASTNDANWEHQLELQRDSIRGVSPASRRSQKALWAVEQALNGAQFFTANASRYRFSGTDSSFTFISTLPESFPGVKDSGGPLPRRVKLFLEACPGNQSSLLLEHTPLLLDGHVEPFRIMLSRDVGLFMAHYFDETTLTWTNSWTRTNAMPREMSLTTFSRHEFASRRVALPGTAVPPEFQGLIPTNTPPTNGPHRLGANKALDAPSASTTANQKRSRLWPLRTEKHAVELEWLGRSGVELARYILAHPEGNGVQFDALNQKWAGGVGDSNSPIAHIPMQDFPLGGGIISLRMVDLESKFTINLGLVAPELLYTAVLLAGVEPSEAPSIVEAIQDWQDADDTPRASGAESDYYLTLDPPHRAKNGPFDDISELLLVRGVTPRLFFGSTNAGESAVGLRDLFASVSGQFININTASPEVMQTIPDVDGNLAEAIVTFRVGPDGIEGNEDDQPFRSISELLSISGFSGALVQQIVRYARTRSSIFEVTVDIKLGRQTRQYSAWLRRSGSSVHILKFVRTK